MAKIRVRWRDLFFLSNKAMQLAMIWPEARLRLKELQKEDPVIGQMYSVLDEIWRRIKR